MQRVTSIEQQKKPGSKRLNVFLDGRYALSLVEDLAARLQPGDYLSDAEIAELRRQDDMHQVYDAALTLLSYRPRSVSELRARLERKGYDPRMVAEVLEKLESQRVIGDEEFARFWVENRQTHNPRGSRLLRAELRFKGVDGETIDGALPAEDEEGTAALRVGRAKARSLKGLEWRDFRRRLGDHLVRRGFSYSTAGDVARRIWAEERGEAEDEDTDAADAIEALQDVDPPGDREEG